MASWKAAARGLASAQVAALAEGIMNVMLFTKVKSAALVVDVLAGGRP